MTMIMHIGSPRRMQLTPPCQFLGSHLRLKALTRFESLTRRRFSSPTDIARCSFGLHTCPNWRVSTCNAKNFKSKLTNRQIHIHPELIPINIKVDSACNKSGCSEIPALLNPILANSKPDIQCHQIAFPISRQF